MGAGTGRMTSCHSLQDEHFNYTTCPTPQKVPLKAPIKIAAAIKLSKLPYLKRVCEKACKHVCMGGVVGGVMVCVGGWGGGGVGDLDRERQRQRNKEIFQDPGQLQAQVSETVSSPRTTPLGTKR